MLHDQAVHGRFRVRLPSQPVAVARRRRRREQAGKRSAPGAARQFHLPERRREHVSAGSRRREAGRDRAPLHRRRDRACRGADRDRFANSQLVPPTVGHRILGTGVCRLGLSESHLRAAHLSARAVRIPIGRRRGQPVPDGCGIAEGVRRRDPSQARSGRTGRAEHLSGDGTGQEGQEAAHVTW